MSVLLFMPESGGNPLDSVILTSTDDDGDFLHPLLQEGEADATISRLDFQRAKKNGGSRPAAVVRKLSSDSAASMLDFSIQSAPIHERNNSDDEDDMSSLGADNSHKSSSDNSSGNNSTSSRNKKRQKQIIPQHRRPLNRNPSYGTATSAKSAPARYPTIADAKLPQLRLTPVGAMLGATTGGAMVVKVVNKAQERRRQSQQLNAAADTHVKTPGSKLMRVHSGVYV